MTGSREPAAEHPPTVEPGRPTGPPRALALALGAVAKAEAELARLDDVDREALARAGRYAFDGRPGPVRPGDLEAFRQARRT